MQRSLTDAERKELDALTGAVTAAIDARRAWLDKKMLECSSIKPGDAIFDLESGRQLGVVSKLYRYWRDRDEGVRDTDPHCDYEFETQTNCFDNTSRQLGLLVGTREQAAALAEARWRGLQG